MAYVRSRWDEWPRLPERFEVIADKIGRGALRVWVVSSTVAVLGATTWNIYAARDKTTGSSVTRLFLEAALVIVGVVALELTAASARGWRRRTYWLTFLLALLTWLGVLAWTAFGSAQAPVEAPAFFFRSSSLAWAVSNVASGIAAYRGRGQEPQRAEA